LKKDLNIQAFSKIKIYILGGRMGEMLEDVDEFRRRIDSIEENEFDELTEE